MKIRVLLCEDQHLFRQAMEIALQSASDIEVVGTAQNGRTAVAAVRKLKPQVVVMDVAMPELNGIDATRQIKAEGLPCEVVGLSMYSKPEYVFEMLQAGAAGFILKQNNFDEFTHCIRKVANGMVYLCQEAQALIVDNCRRPNPDPSKPLAPVQLTSREREVLQLIAEGKTNKQIASILNISVKTVEAHRAQILDKLDLRTLPELTKYAISIGLTSIDF